MSASVRGVEDVSLEADDQHLRFRSFVGVPIVVRYLHFHYFIRFR